MAGYAKARKSSKNNRQPHTPEYHGALNLKALTSPLICEYKTINEYNVSRFFNEIRKVYPDYNQKIHVILDGAGYHRSQLVKDWAEVVNIRLHYLPLQSKPESDRKNVEINERTCPE